MTLYDKIALYCEKYNDVNKLYEFLNKRLKIVDYNCNISQIKEYVLEGINFFVSIKYEDVDNLIGNRGFEIIIDNIYIFIYSIDYKPYSPYTPFVNL